MRGEWTRPSSESNVHCVKGRIACTPMFVFMSWLWWWKWETLRLEQDFIPTLLPISAAGMLTIRLSIGSPMQSPDPRAPIYVARCPRGRSRLLHLQRTLTHCCTLPRLCCAWQLMTHCLMYWCIHCAVCWRQWRLVIGFYVITCLFTIGRGS